MNNLVRILILLLILVPGIMAQAQGTPTTPVPATFFGHHLMHTSDWPSASFGLVRTWDNYHVSWAWVEPSANTYDWTNLDALVTQAVNNGKDIIYTFGLTPGWATGGACSNAEGCANPPTSISNWDNFVTTIVTRYHTKIKYWECWNEANNTSQFWLGTFTQLVNQCHDLYTIAKGIDSGLTILTPSATGGSSSVSSFFNSYFGAGGGAYADAIAFHGYPSNCCGSGSNPAPEEVNGIISNLKTSMSNNGQGGKPIWDTEGGWGTDATTTSSANQAAFLARHYLLQWSDGVTRYAWYAWDNGTWGTLWNSGAGVAYQQVYNWMVGATMSIPCAIQSGSVWTCTLTRSGGYRALAVWSTGGSSTYTVPTGYTQYKDLTGGTATLNGSSVTIGIQPILLESTSTPTAPAAPSGLTATVH